VLAESYERYLAAIAAARATIEASPFIRDDADRMVAEEFLRIVVNWSLAIALNVDPARPMMQLLPYPDTRLGFNNPDNLYYVARVSDTGSYRISGRRGTSVGFVILAMRELPGNGRGSGATTAFLTQDDLEVAADGSYEIALSREQPTAGNWLALTPGTDNLLVRFTFQDWSRERPGSISIDRIDRAEMPPFEMTTEHAVAILDDAARSMVLQANFYRDQGTALTALPANTMLAPRVASGAGVHATQWNSSGRFDLADDEALIVTLEDAPQARYFDIMLADPWLNTFEFIEHQVSLNRAQATLDADGRLRLVVSARDPQVPNWLDTTGQSHGVLFSRWQDCSVELTAQHTPKVQVVKLVDVRGELPDDTGRVDPEMRARQLADRASMFRARFTGADPSLPEIVARRDSLERLLGRSLPLQTIGNAI
jgi:hypothetical protein